MQVWKYPFHIEDYFSIITKLGARPLLVAMQGNNPCIWMLVDPNAGDVEMKFHIAGTGHEIKESETKVHVGSFLMNGGQFVWHVFQLN